MKYYTIIIILLLFVLSFNVNASLWDIPRNITINNVNNYNINPYNASINNLLSNNITTTNLFAYNVYANNYRLNGNVFLSYFNNTIYLGSVLFNNIYSYNDIIFYNNAGINASFIKNPYWLNNSLGVKNFSLINNNYYNKTFKIVFNNNNIISNELIIPHIVFHQATDTIITSDINAVWIGSDSNPAATSTIFIDYMSDFLVIYVNNIKPENVVTILGFNIEKNLDNTYNGYILYLYNDNGQINYIIK